MPAAKPEFTGRALRVDKRKYNPKAGRGRAGSMPIGMGSYRSLAPESLADRQAASNEQDCGLRKAIEAIACSTASTNVNRASAYSLDIYLCYARLSQQ